MKAETEAKIWRATKVRRAYEWLSKPVTLAGDTAGSEIAAASDDCELQSWRTFREAG